MNARRGERGRGQATVELALAMPFVVLLVLVVVQAGVVAHRRVQVVHAAREGARIAAVDPSRARVEDAVRRASSLDPALLDVDIQRGDDTVTVRVRYTDPTDVAVIGDLVGAIVLTESATMRAE